MRPGDIAVTFDGVHVLAYCGDREWIEADPELHRVAKLTVPQQENFWFKRPVHLLRWCILDDQSP